MFERFTERSRQVVQLGQDEARLKGHGWIGTEHLLLGLIREEEGLAALVLREVGVTYEEVDERVRRILSGDETVKAVVDEESARLIPFTPRAKKVLELALREALSLGHNYIGTEHILLGLLRENEGVAAQVIRDLVEAGTYSCAEERIRNEVIRMLSGPERREERRPPLRIRPPGQRVQPPENGGIREQHVMAILAYLIEKENTPAGAVYDAVSYALDLTPGQSISFDDHMLRSFVGEQMVRLSRG